MTPGLRDMKVVEARWDGTRWLLALPDGIHEAADDAEAARLVQAWAHGSSIRWVVPTLAAVVESIAAEAGA